MRSRILKIVLPSAVILIVAAAGIFATKTPEGVTLKPRDADRKISCLGQIVPEDSIIHLAMPASSYPGPSPVAELRVKEGDMLTNGQIVAVLENHHRLQTAWKSAEAQAKVAAQRLKQIQAGAKPADIAAQKSEVELRLREHEAAALDFQRKSELQKLNTISQVEFERSQLALETSQKRLETARQNLRSLEQVRDVDLALAEAQLHSAEAEAEHSEAEAGQSVIRSPIEGQVIRILTRPGEIIGKEGLAELAKTQSMMVLAEVYETDLRWVHRGQSVEIHGTALPRTIRGTVEQIGLIVGRNQLFTIDPASADDARVVEVRIRLPQNPDAPRLIHTQVTVFFDSSDNSASPENAARKL